LHNYRRGLYEEVTDLTSQELIKEFQRMYQEHWSYVWGAANSGCVDCSGAFVYALTKYGLSIAHGSNSIARNHIVGQLLPIDQAQPGMVAFKCRPWAESERGNKWYGQPPGDVHHVGLVDDDVRYVLNAKGEKYGFSRDPIRSWDYVAYLKNITYEKEEASKMQTATVVLPLGAAGKTVNFRTRPDRDAQLVERVPVGSQVEVLEDQGAWVKIQWAGKTGYMMSNYIEYEGQDGESMPDLTDDDRIQIDQALKAIETAVDIIGNIVGRG
jgi:hypothetical protein